MGQVTCSLSSWSSVFASPFLSVWMQHQNQNLKPNQNPGWAVPILAILHTMVAILHTMVAILHTMVAIPHTMVAIPHTMVAIPRTLVAIGAQVTKDLRFRTNTVPRETGDLVPLQKILGYQIKITTVTQHNTILMVVGIIVKDCEEIPVSVAMRGPLIKQIKF